MSIQVLYIPRAKQSWEYYKTIYKNYNIYYVIGNKIYKNAEKLISYTNNMSVKITIE